MVLINVRLQNAQPWWLHRHVGVDLSVCLALCRPTHTMLRFRCFDLSWKCRCSVCQVRLGACSPESTSLELQYTHCLQFQVNFTLSGISLITSWSNKWNYYLWSDIVPMSCFILALFIILPPLYCFPFTIHKKRFFFFLCGGTDARTHTEVWKADSWFLTSLEWQQSVFHFTLFVGTPKLLSQSAYEKAECEGLCVMDRILEFSDDTLCVCHPCHLLRH